MAKSERATSPEAETSRRQHAGFAEAVVAPVGPDDEVVEQRDVDHVGCLREPLGESGGKGFSLELPTAKISPFVVNQSPCLPEPFSYCSL